MKIKILSSVVSFTLFVAVLVFYSNCNQPKEQVENQPKSDSSLTATTPPVKNIIFMIGDGMGISHLCAGYTANKDALNIMQAKHIGFITTFSADDYVTDSAAAGTAMACGTKTKNGMIGVDSTGKAVTSILELAEQNQLATGLVSTSAITHATPAAFIAHQPDRHWYEKIAADFLKTDIDVFIGGGKDYFTNRKDGQNLADQLKTKGYRVLYNLDSIVAVKEGKLAGLTAPEHNPPYSEGRADMLPKATQTSLDILSKNQKGFFLMVEGSQIDWGGHENNIDYIINETLDFDRAVGKALEFAQNNPNTLVVVTADHETGGLGLNQGNISKGTVEAGYTTEHHTGVMVPVYAFGPGAENFTGFFDNTDFITKFKKLYKFD